MKKRQLIDAIRRFNQTARAEFLAGFTERELLEYLQHLEDVLGNPSGGPMLQPVMVA